MGVQLFITRQGTPEPHFYSMTGSSGWERVWLPASVELGLDLIPPMGDGSSCITTPEELSAVMAQLTLLREWMAAHGHDLYTEHLDRILPALSTIRVGVDEVSFG